MSSEELFPFTLEEITSAIDQFETPIHLYHEEEIRRACRRLKDCFNWNTGYCNYYAVKANPNPHILQIIKEEDFGVDCSSMTELRLAERVGFTGDKILFTSNETPIEEYRYAKKLNAIINIDDISHIDFIHEKIGLPEMVSFRYNPGQNREGNSIIGNPIESKFGLTHSQLFKSYFYCKKLGVKRFGLHTMIISNTLNEEDIINTSKLLFDLVIDIYEKLDVIISFVNFGGGFGVNYKKNMIQDEEKVEQKIGKNDKKNDKKKKVEDKIEHNIEEEKKKELDLNKISNEIKKLYDTIIVENPKIPIEIKNLKLATECGRYLLAKSGVLLTRVIHHKNIYKKYIGVDSCMSDFMRCGMYNAYHHIVHIKVNKLNSKLQEKLPTIRNCFVDDFCQIDEGEKIKEEDGYIFDVVGSLCENNDKFAVNRKFNDIPLIGDVLVITDTGAHGHSMAFNYNGKLRTGEVLYSSKNNKFTKIRRREDFFDLTSTILNWKWLGRETLLDISGPILASFFGALFFYNIWTK